MQTIDTLTAALTPSGHTVQVTWDGAGPAPTMQAVAGAARRASGTGHPVRRIGNVYTWPLDDERTVHVWTFVRQR